MRWAALLAICAMPAAAAEEAGAGAFWQALLGCWAVKDGGEPGAQGWTLARDWAPLCTGCDESLQEWRGAAGLRILLQREAPGAVPSCALAEPTWPQAEDTLPGLDAIWAGEELAWIGEDLRREDQPFAILLSCEPEVARRKVAVIDASGGRLRFSVTGWGPDQAGMCGEPVE